MSLRVLSLLALGCCLLAWPAHALDPDKAYRHYVHDNWSVPEGLPQISAISITQTRDGYIWAGTQSGLARFDGVGFTTFTPGNEPALPHLFVHALASDSSGALWIGTYAGMAVHRDGRFEKVPWAGLGDEPLINAIRISADGQPWAATASGAAPAGRPRRVLARYATLPPQPGRQQGNCLHPGRRPLGRGFGRPGATVGRRHVDAHRRPRWDQAGGTGPAGGGRRSLGGDRHRPARPWTDRVAAGARSFRLQRLCGAVRISRPRRQHLGRRRPRPAAHPARRLCRNRGGDPYQRAGEPDHRVRGP